MRILRPAAVLAVLAASLLSLPVHADGAGLALNLEAGWDGGGQVGAWVPIVVTARNDSAGEFNGTLVLQPKRSAGNGYAYPGSSTAYQEPIALARGAEKRVTIFGQFADYGGGTYEATLVDPGGAVLSRSNSGGVNPNAFTIGLLSDSSQAESELRDVRLRAITAVVHFTPQTLPDSPLLLSGLAAIVIGDFDSSTLSQAQSFAITDYVGLGGTLVITAGSSWRRTFAHLPTPLVALRPEAGATVSMAPLMDLLEQTSTVQAPAVTGPVAAAARVVLADAAGTPLLVEMGYGLGRVEELTVDPAADPIAGRSGETKQSWAAALGRTLSGLNLKGFGQGPGPIGGAGFGPGQPPALFRTSTDNWVAAILGDAPQNALPPLGLLGGLLVLYVLLAGPANYALTKALRRRELMWISVPLIAVIFTGGAYGAGLLTHGTDFFVNEVQVIRLAPSGTADATVYDALFAPRRGDFDIQLAEGSLASTSVQSVYTSGGGGSSADHIVIGRNPVVALRDVAVWSPRSLRSEDTSREQAGVESHLRLAVLAGGGREVSGTLTNHGRLPVRDVALITGSGDVFRLAAIIPPGAVATVKVVAEPHSLSPAPCFRCPGPNSAVISRDDSILQAAAAEVPSGGPVQALVGRLDPVAGFKVNGATPTRTAVAAFVEGVAMESVDAVLPTWSSPRLAAAETSTGSGLAVYDFELPALPLERPLAMSISTPQGYSGGTEIYDWSTRAWHRIGATPVDLPPALRGPGLVRIRVSGAGFSQGIQVTTPGSL